jgi:C-terminal processing protease CtpA/Prc
MEETLPGGIRLIVIRGFWPGAGRQIVRAWNAAATSGGPGVILDLRVAGGECPLAAADAAALALPPGNQGIEFESILDGRRTAHSGAAHDVRVSGPTMLLVGPGTEGAAEVFAAALKARGRHVMLLGQPTAGDPCIREPIGLGDDRWMRVASRRLRVGGEPVEIPVLPHIAIDEGKGNGAALRATRSADRIAMNPRRRALDEEAVDEALLLRVGDDAVLERAVDMLRALQALHR